MYCLYPTELQQNHEITLGVAGLWCFSIPTASQCSSAGFSVQPQLTPLITEREILLPWGRSCGHYGLVDYLPVLDESMSRSLCGKLATLSPRGHMALQPIISVD